MPDPPHPKPYAHPIHRSREKREEALGAWSDGLPRYAELHAVSNFTFLRGASHPDELVEQAASLGYEALAITDEHSLAGIVRAHAAAREINFKLLIGSEIHLVDEMGSMLLIAPDRQAYGRLCRLLTQGRRRGDKGTCPLTQDDIRDFHQGLLAILLPDPKALDPGAGLEALEEEQHRVSWLATLFQDRCWLGASLHEGFDDRLLLHRLEMLSQRLDLDLVALGGAEAHVPERRAVRDTLHAIHHGCEIAALGERLPPQVRWLRERQSLATLYRSRPDLLSRTLEIADRCSFCLDELRYEYPDEIKGRDLPKLVAKGATERWPQGVPERVQRLIDRELALIEELKYENYFLTVYDIVHFARSRGILCQGRGSAANSAVCFVLGITSVDPDRFDVLFERFVSKDRNEPPDIDVDFEHERREEVIQYIYNKYGRHRAGMAATVITYRGRSALREVGKALGLTLDQVDRLAKASTYWEDLAPPPQYLREVGLDAQDPTVRRVLALTRHIQGFPRHLSQHVGGLVITRGRLDEVVPIENASMQDRTVIQWDKDDLDALGMLKVDCLALGMLSAIRKAFSEIERIRGISMNLATVPSEVPAVYQMASNADTVGVFQIESRAQMAMLPRFKPRCFYDLVIEVAIVRPGPIQGGMVHPYLRRRSGKEKVQFPSEAVRSVLEKTLGVPIFQEQAMKLAMVAAGFSPSEADQLRRSMSAWRRRGNMDGFEKRLIEGMKERGYTEDFAQSVFRQLQGFGEYGFPESHAASFALLTYVSLWLKRFEPAIFAASLLNSQPMGFYQPAQIIQDARRHGVRVLPVDVLSSQDDCTLSTEDCHLAPCSENPHLPASQYGRGGPDLRLGLRMVRGLSQNAIDRLLEKRQKRSKTPAWSSLPEFLSHTQIPRRDALCLAEAGAFANLESNRRKAWWEASTPQEYAPLFEGSWLEESCLIQEEPNLQDLAKPDRIFADYHRVGASLEGHPIALIRTKLQQQGVLKAKDLVKVPSRRWVTVAGLCLCRQRPGTASGILFITLEDETGFINLIMRPPEQKRFRQALAASAVFRAAGRVEKAEGVIHLMVARLEDLSGEFPHLALASRDFH